MYIIAWLKTSLLKCQTGFYCILSFNFFVYFHTQSKLRVRKQFTFFSKKNTGLNFCKFLVIIPTAFPRISRKENSCINYTENFGKVCIMNFGSISVSSKTFQNFGLNGALHCCKFNSLWIFWRFFHRICQCFKHCLECLTYMYFVNQL